MRRNRKCPACDELAEYEFAKVYVWSHLCIVDGLTWYTDGIIWTRIIQSLPKEAKLVF